MSNTLLEAMASGIPVVCTRVGGNVELVADRQRGALVDAGDHVALARVIQEYVSSPNLCSAYASKAREFVVEHFSLDRMIDRYSALYESVA